MSPLTRSEGVRLALMKPLADLSRIAAVLIIDSPLEQLEAKASHFHVPLFYANLLYTLHMHIIIVRRRLNKLEGAQETDW